MPIGGEYGETPLAVRMAAFHLMELPPRSSRHDNSAFSTPGSRCGLPPCRREAGEYTPRPSTTSRSGCRACPRAAGKGHAGTAPVAALGSSPATGSAPGFVRGLPHDHVPVAAADQAMVRLRGEETSDPILVLFLKFRDSLTEMDSRFRGMTASLKVMCLAEMTSFPRSLCLRKRVAGIHRLIQGILNPELELFVHLARLSASRD